MGRLSRYLLLLLIGVFVLMPTFAYASNTQSTGYTITIDTDDKMQISQDAYLPSGVFLDLDLEQAEDLFILNNTMYIADTGNGRCIVIDLDTNNTKIIGEDILNQPKGISADDDGNIYVADYGNREAYRFDKGGSLEKTFVKPDTPKFGKNAEYNPTKIIPADDGGVYVVSEGSTAGMVHMNRDGVFLGYFGSSDVHMTPFEHMLNMILNEQQMQRYLKKTPPSFANVFRGVDGLIYSINRGSNVGIVKHNLGGLNILDEDRVPSIDEAKDICVTVDGRMFIIDLDGYVTEMTKDGYHLCTFAGPANGEDRVGLFYIPSGIGTDDRGNVYVLDQEKNYIQMFTPTPNQVKLHEAVNSYNAGNYDSSMGILKELLNFNNTSMVAHTYMGKNYMQQGSYKEAAKHFKIANAKEDYSQAYWEIRNIWLQENLFIIFILILLAMVVYLIYRKVSGPKVHKAYSKHEQLLQQLGQKKSIAKDIGRIKYAALHPIDNAYGVRIGHFGSLASATLIYGIFFVIYVTLKIDSGFIYSTNIKNFSGIGNFVGFITIVILFTLGNYFISSIKEGKGTIRSIYLVGAYSLAPALIILPFVILLSNVSTYDESFFINLALAGSIVWCCVNLVVALMEIHEYNFREILGNILMTLFSMVVAVIVLSLSYLMIGQIFGFVKEVYMEVRLRG